MIEAIKSVLKQAAQARGTGEAAEAERLLKEAAADAKAKDDVAQAEILLSAAQTLRDADDRSSAAMNYAEAITLLRSTNDAGQLAFALRHAADVRSQLHEYAAAGSQIEEAIRLYRGLATEGDAAASLNIANALRVSALNNERQAHAQWTEAEALYTAGDVAAGMDESRTHLQQLEAAAERSTLAETTT